MGMGVICFCLLSALILAFSVTNDIGVKNIFLNYHPG
jgi:hypothetical protein